MDAYIKSDLIQTDDVWTIRKIALCYRLMGDYEKALEFYLNADYLKPDQLSVLMQIGHCYVELGKFKDALNVYFKLDALGDDNVRVWRAISWCSFISGNIKQADYYVNKLIENEPTSHDYLNAGHVSWCEHKLEQAIDFYRKSLNLQNNNWDIFMEAFNEDKKFLIANGIDADEIPLFIDELNPLEF